MAHLSRVDCDWDGSQELPLASWLPLLAPKGAINVSCPQGSEASLRSALLFGGFVNITSASSPEGRVCVTGSKPEWEIGASAKIGGARLGQAAVVKVVLGDLADDDLVDEDDLLNDIAVPPVGVEGGGCATKKRACADCSCGRAELEAAGDEEAAAAMAANPSACGNCSKGDAFRCASCPHLGKPAFKPGQENLTLNLDMDDI